MFIAGRNGRYEVTGDAVADAGAYRLYRCSQEGADGEKLLQIATDKANNGELDRNAYFLRELASRASELELKYAKKRKDEKSFLNYNLEFPELVETFVCPEQGNRRINILAFRNVERVEQMVPISNIIGKDHQRVDLRTSAWILGKLLKLFVFAHSEGISVGRLDASNILIEPKQHYVLIFDWSKAKEHANGRIPDEIKRGEIKKIASVVIELISDDKGLPAEFEEKEADYLVALQELAESNQGSAERAHQRFYGLITRLWGRQFHPFTTYQR
ncbi:MAG TPA: hypothetical protein VFQ60_04855 [Patescibacteria group bacterium]|nr:hypothetical protein [Patescibacteria group bacterium]